MAKDLFDPSLWMQKASAPSRKPRGPVSSEHNVARLARMMARQYSVPEPKSKLPRKPLLVKVKYHDTYMHVYKDGTYRLTNDASFKEWKLAHSELGSIFLYKEDGEEGWRTDWESLDDEETRLGNTIAKALADFEVERMLKGEHDISKTSDSDPQGSEHEKG